MPSISNLTEFNHALIYAFEPESSPARLSGSETFKDALFPEAEQHEDMLRAYLYAQEIILPFIRQNGFEKVDERLFLEWINTLHEFIGKALLAAHGRKSGEYTKEAVLRWHQGAQIGSDVALFMSNKHPKCKSKSQFVDFLVESKISFDDATVFVDLLYQIRESSLKAHPSQLPFIDKKSPYLKGITTLHKLITAYHSKQLSPTEKKALDNIVKICCYPEDIPPAMKNFATETLTKLRTLDRKNLPQIAKCLAETFYRFTEIHPFANANGRTGTCIINIFLRAFDLPSILLRHPGEKENESSLYSQAIAQIDKTLEPLTELILKRIRDAQEKPFVDEELKTVIALRLTLSTLLQNILKKYPTLDIDGLQKQISPITMLAISISPNSNKSAMIILSELIHLAREEEKKMDAVFSKLFLPQPTVSATEKEQIVNALEKLTGLTGWKTANSKLIVWIDLPDYSANEIADIVLNLQSTQAIEVSSGKRSDNGIPSIQCRNINIAKLLELANTGPNKLSAESLDNNNNNN
ncbi:Fic family protein [Legionella hackeliae]|uniref:Fido domain-containing protein n=1 Tax=Legionella hackeliae TaxID=449 RepID=A0A0A8UQQ4_LEGHA|nr:Fic family protein [Legionella hackeliae]KTD15460.1 Fic/DOC family protein [Legionella hackeliae]CEK11170.1 conserved protein of unknown function [Legionella hackeliae]STX47935.1 Fic/DOC family [Legionella hackeliae]